MPPLKIGYIDVVTNASTTRDLKAFPLLVNLEVGVVPPWWDDPDNPASLAPFLLFLSGNVLDIGSPGHPLYVGAAVRRVGPSGQSIEIAVVPDAALVDLAVTVRINTSVDTSLTDYNAHPTPTRGESFVIVGTSSVAGGPLPPIDVVVGTVNDPNADAVDPDSTTQIAIRADLRTQVPLIVGQRRQKTAGATYADPHLGSYRRAIGADDDTNLEGILLDATLQNATATGSTWTHVAITQPDSPDGPPRAPTVAPAASAGALTPGNQYQYQVSWVHGVWQGTTYVAHKESSLSPLTPPIATTTGSIAVDLPDWQDPHAPGLVPPAPPQQVVAWRIYRTIGGHTAGGDTFLVHEEPAPITNVGDVVPGHPWTDTAADSTLSVPARSALSLALHSTIDYSATQEGTGLSLLSGDLLQSSYEEDAGGTAQFRGKRYHLEVASTPAAIEVSYSTRPLPGSPRVTWKSSTGGSPAGVPSASITVSPTGVAVSADDTVDAILTSVPPEFGVDWSQRGAERFRLEVGSAADTGNPLPQGLGMITARSSVAGTAHPPPSPRSLNADLLPDDLSFTGRRLRRFRLQVGLPRPDSPVYATDADGLVAEVELESAQEGSPRSLRVRRDAPSHDNPLSLSRVVARVGELPDSFVLDMRPGNPFPDDGSTPVTLAARLIGNLRRVAVLYQSPEQLALPASNVAGRRDGVWVTVPASGRQLDIHVDSAAVEVAASEPLRADASMRSTAGLGTTDPVRLAQASVTATDTVHVGLPQPDGSMALNATSGVSGSVAISSRALDAAQPDRLLATRATPQAKVALRRATISVPLPGGLNGVVERRALDDLAARWLGVSSLSKPADTSPPHFSATLQGGRSNRSLRAQAVLTDDRITPSTFLFARARIADVPEKVDVLADTSTNHFTIDADRRSGRVLLVAQPPQVDIDGARAGQLVGVGFVKADVESLPTHTEVDLLGGSNPLQAEPFNDTPDASWVRSGIRVKTNAELVVRALQLINVSYVRPPTFPCGTTPSIELPSTAFWSNLAGAILRISSEDTSEPGAVWIWTPHQPIPAGSTDACAWVDLDSWLGYRIESPSLVRLQFQPYEAATTTIPTWWSDSFAWNLKAEFQMDGYRGEVTVDGPWPEGDTDSGPGKWTLRVPDGIPPFGGQIVFGNTGGWFSNRPRIFDPFTPPPNVIPSF